MSFRYRTVGYSPEYAVTIGANNEFQNTNDFKSLSVVNFEAGALLTIADAPAANTHAANKLYVDTLGALKLNLTGGTLSGTLTTTNITQTGAATFTSGTGTVTLNGNTTVVTGKKLSLIDAPTVPTDAANKDYVDLFLPLSGGILSNSVSFSAGNLTLYAHPTSTMHAATMGYVDGKLGNFDAGDGLAVTAIDVTKTGTYSQTTNVITIDTSVAHGFSFGSVIFLTFSGATPSDPPNGPYVITSIVDTDTFTITAPDSLSRTGGSVIAQLKSNQVSVVSAADTLNIQANSLDLKTIHTGGLFQGGSSFSNSTWYNNYKVDQYGRITDGRSITISTPGDGWYNKVQINGGYITQAASEAYLTANQTVTLTGDVSGSGTTAITTSLSTMPGLVAGTYSKITVNNKGRVTAAAGLSSSDIVSALGFMPHQESDVLYTHLKGSFVASSNGTAPISLTYSAGENYTISGNYIFVPRGIYHVTFSGSNNWWATWYNNYWYNTTWWSTYWNYYYQPSVIYLNETPQAAAFSNYGGWWWYWTANTFDPSISQDFCISDTVNVTTDNSYLKFGMPLLAGVTYYYNIKIVKLK